MPALIPENPTPREHHALMAMLPERLKLEAAQRGDILALLDRCDTEDDLADTFANAVIEQGGTWMPAQGPLTEDGAPRSRRTNHVHEVALLGAFGIGATLPAAIASWRKSAQRMGRA